MTYDDSELQQHIANVRAALSPAEQAQLLMAIALTMGDVAMANIPAYPAPSRKPLPKIYLRVRKDGTTYMSKWPTEKSERWFWWALRTGQLRIPYNRTMVLFGSFTYQVVEASADRIVIEVGTNIKYAPWVVDEDRQAPYHQGTWWTLQSKMRKARPQIVDEGTRTAIRELRGRIGK